MEQNTENVTIQVNKSNGAATAGFVLAIIALFLGWVPVLGWLLWVLGLIFSSVGIAQASNVDGAGKGLAIAGLIISFIGVIFLLVVFGALVALAAVIL